MKYIEFIKKNNKARDEYLNPYIIAEAGVNHEGSLETAIRLINEAADGGADAIKFQTYKADKIASKDSPAYWDLSKEKTDSQYKLFQKYDSFWKNEYEILKIHCDKSGIEFMSTPFDIESAKFLNDLMDVYKISSSDINNKPFIKYICDFRKPIILSTGASTIQEIDEALSWVPYAENNVAILQCILNYPTEDKNANLGMILDLKKRYQNHIIGYSDHTLPKEMKTLEIATLIGARILEKHFTHDKNLPGNDHYHAMDKFDLINFKKNLEEIQITLGKTKKNFIETEKISRNNARRSLVSLKKIIKGEKISESHLTWKRPAKGINPKFIDKLVGKKAIVDINDDTILQWEMFDG